MENDRMDEMSDTGYIEDAYSAPSKTSRFTWLAVGALVGVGVMYLLDPAQGRRRRSKLMTRSNQLYKAVREYWPELKEMPIQHATGSEVTSRGEYLQSH